jgi:TusA-related sulfurtransferase
MIQIDTRGLSCPQPVVLVNMEIRKGSKQFEILLDSQASQENVARLLKKNNLDYEIIQKEDHVVYHVR